MRGALSTTILHRIVMQNVYFFLLYFFVILDFINIAQHNSPVFCHAKYPPYETRYFDVQVDHFPSHPDSRTFKLKYLLNRESWKGDGPIFFYCGNEEKIEYFYDNSGFLMELGKQLSALVVFAEHRYYGSSLPFGNVTFSNHSNLKYLSVSQTLADFAALIKHLKMTMTHTDTAPVIAFGGSYGGLLAGWFRQSYPNLILGSLASSAPFVTMGNIKRCNKANEIATRAFHKKGSQACVDNIRSFWTALSNMNSTIGHLNLTKIFRLCKNLETVDVLKVGVSNNLYQIAVDNYPYPTNSTKLIPAWPVSAFCVNLSVPIKDPVELVKAVASAFQIYFNYTGDIQCINSDYNKLTETNLKAWDYQTCTELPFPSCQNGITDMFYKLPFDLKSYNEDCLTKYATKPDWSRIEHIQRRNSISTVSNIIFSNGLLDPWSSGGIYFSKSKSSKIIVIKNGAHHVDLRGSNPNDTDDIRMSRIREASIIRSWIGDWNKMLKNNIHSNGGFN